MTGSWRPRYRVAMFAARGLRYFPPARYEAQALSAQGWQVQVYTVAERPRRGTEHAGALEEERVLSLLTRAVPAGRLLGIKYAELSLRQVAASARWPAQLYVAHDLSTLPQTILAARLQKAPVVYRAHELWCERRRVPARRLWRLFEKALCRQANLVVTPTPERADFLQQRLRLATPPLVVMNCPPLRRATRGGRLAQRLAAAGHEVEGRRVVIYQGTLADSRCVLEIVAGAAQLPRGILIALVGPVDDRLRPRLNAALGQARDRIALLPAVSNDEVWDLVCSADAGIALYRPDCLNNILCAPNKIFEYMMAGLPIVASRNPSLDALVAHNGVGVVVDPENPADIARGILAVLDRDVSERMRRRGIELSAERYNWEAQFAPLLRAYSSLIAQHVAERQR